MCPGIGGAAASNARPAYATAAAHTADAAAHAAAAAASSAAVLCDAYVRP